MLSTLGNQTAQAQYYIKNLCIIFNNSSIANETYINIQFIRLIDAAGNGHNK